MMTIKIPLMMLFLLLLALSAAGCAGASTPAEETAEPEIAEEIASVVSSTGVVVPPEWSTLSASTSGIVEEVLMKEGEIVQDGQVLMRLQSDPDLLLARVAAQTETLSAQQALNNLDENTTSARAQALQDIANATRSVKEAQYQLDNFTIPHTQRDLEAMEAVQQMKEKRDQAWAVYKPYKAKEVCNDYCDDLQERWEDAQSEYNSAVRRLELETALSSAQTDLEQAIEDLGKVKEGPDPDELSLAQARLENAQAALAAAEAEIQDLEFRAMIPGTISEVYVRPGEWVAPGQPILLVGELERLQVETTDLNEIDVARLGVGDPATITFDALPDVTVGGSVAEVALKSSEGSGVNYKVTIELDEIPENLRWGMTAFVDITVE